MPAVTHLLYLHGFRSSPRSTKARTLAHWIARHRPDLVWCCPQLPPSPREAMASVFDRLAGWPPAHTAVVGSSLGGFYATVVAGRLGCRVVLLNPAVNPARDLTSRVGETTAWHSDEPFMFQAGFIDELLALTSPAPLDPQRCLAVIAKGDELLDWREMCARYAGCRIKLLEGGDHALSDFETHLGDVTGFLGLTSEPTSRPPAPRSRR